MTASELKLNVEKAIEEIRPYLITDGGDIELISVDNNEVKVQFRGACIDCRVNQMTLKNGVEETIKKFAPQIEKVIEVK